MLDPRQSNFFIRYSHTVYHSYDLFIKHSCSDTLPEYVPLSSEVSVYWKSIHIIALYISMEGTISHTVRDFGFTLTPTPRRKREATRGMTSLLGKYQQYLVSPTWGTWCFSQQEPWDEFTTCMVQPCTERVCHAVLDQTHPQLSQWSKHFLITVLLYRTSLSRIGFTDPLLFPIVLCTHHSSWCCKNK